MPLLEEARSRADLVRDAAPGQLDLQLERLVVRAVEHRDVRQLLALVVPLEDPLADEARLVGDVGERDHGGHRPGVARGAQLLRKLPLVLRDGRVGEREDLRRGPIVAREPVRLRVRVALREAEDVLEGRAAERVDRLGVVADHGDVALRLRHPVDDLALQLVRVLVLVDEDVVVGATRAARRPRLPRRAGASTGGAGRRSRPSCPSRLRSR